MNIITYEYIDYKSEKFKEVIKLRFNVLFGPYGKIDKYDYDEFDKISLHLAVLKDNEVIAYSRMTNLNGEGKITNVVVGPQYTKQGIGVEMLKMHIEESRKQGINKLSLNARIDTVGFYKKVGFNCAGDTFISEKSGLKLQVMNYNLKL
ncbi:GNAT family N-acetyltransferase [Clostridium saccharoperbutylacetonicum]|uniref:GNAT family N-acetyltransferase n=1 Tax=Clostridium saccharoperbutylacetonicum TaxID=36745 RepID=UPI0039E9335C